MLNVLSVLCVSHEAPEDQSETSQQTAAGDEDKGTEKQQVLTSLLMKCQLASWHQLQLISDYRHDYSE